MLLEEWAREKPEPPARSCIWQIYIPIYRVSAYFFVIELSLGTGDREVDFPFHEVWEKQ